MTKKERCQNNETIAYYSGAGGVEIKEIEYGVDDYIIFLSGCWYGHECRAHRRKIYYPPNGRDSAFFTFDGFKIPLDECMRA